MKSHLLLPCLHCGIRILALTKPCNLPQKRSSSHLRFFLLCDILSSLTIKLQSEDFSSTISCFLGTPAQKISRVLWPFLPVDTDTAVQFMGFIPVGKDEHRQRTRCFLVVFETSNPHKANWTSETYRETVFLCIYASV